jgi:prophage tail gpP-like protein
MATKTKWIPPQTLDPTKVKVSISTKWSGTAYKSTTLRRVESYSIASHLDSDADPWSLEIGNIDHDLNAVLERDNEVRVKVFGAGPTSQPMLVGIMDDVTFSEQGTLQLTGRDMSCVAVDSDHFPQIYRGLSPTKIIEMEAKSIQCANKFQIKEIKGGPRKQQTDGSEKYWEFWYRMVRKDGLWIWMLPDGTLVVSDLNYNDAPVYHFVSKTATDRTNSGIPCEFVSYHKTTQSRLGQIAIEWREQTVVAAEKASVSFFDDLKTRGWIKRPQKLLQDKHATGRDSAYKVAAEELFESRVGAIEITITVQDPGFFIRQNRMARLDIPEMGISGDWFIVGSTLRGDSEGFAQEVRLREKKFAISKRVPDDPVWTKDPTGGPSGASFPSGKAASALYAQMGEHSEWYPFYLNAAMKWRGQYDLALFMSTLLAITEHETHFRNIRSNNENDGNGNVISAPGQHEIEWYDIRKSSPSPDELDRWKTNFANQGGDGYVRWNCAVGPMQLFDTGLKVEADGGKADEFYGNRWNPANNIMTAAHALNGKAVTTTGAEADLIAGVCRYGGYSNPFCDYGQYVKNAIHNSPGWLALVQAALSSSQEPSGSQLPGGVPAGAAGEIVKWAKQGVNTGHPKYGAFGGSYKSLPVGSWPAEADCSDFVSICYGWGTSFDERADPNQNEWANGSTATMALHGLNIDPTGAQAGDVVLYLNPITPGIGGDSEHAAIFTENWRGEMTQLASHGGPAGAPPHFIDYGSEKKYHSDSMVVVKRYLS